ncbi:MAG: LysM peptidoglycan-binding domain-containing protein [Thermoflavifilum sp.]|nr:LysM peptidoglycan-binding domain-containing protein [Thermoflavifilum sp.]MCL6515171.1 LysM peptidoglycan-binding domain-containing protein [Alicyclobacillus sp.]
MQARRRWVLAAVAASAVAIGGTTAWAATQGSGQPATHALGKDKAVVLRALRQDLTKQLGISVKTLVSDLKSGETLAQIAQSKGISEQTLIADLSSDVQHLLDQAVSNGKLTTAQEQSLMKRFDAHVQSLVEGRLPAAGMRADRRVWLNDAAQVIGINRATLLQDLKQGESIAQVAQSKGISVNALVSKLMAKEKVRLDQKVSSGKLTQAREQQMLKRLQTQLTRWVEHQPGKTGGQTGTSGAGSTASPT